MALTVLLSTMSFSVDMHYCGDHLVDFSLFDTVDTCMMKSEVSKTSSSCELMKLEMSCCSDVEISFQGQDDLKVSFDQLSFDQQLFITSFSYSYVYLFQNLNENAVSYTDYAPPPLIRDIQVLDQTFLI